MSYYFQSIIDLHLVPLTFYLSPLAFCHYLIGIGRIITKGVFYVCLITIRFVSLNIPQQPFKQNFFLQAESSQQTFVGFIPYGREFRL